MNGSHESLKSTIEIEIDPPSLSVSECVYCCQTTEQGCDCTLEANENDTSSSDYETDSNPPSPPSLKRNQDSYLDPGVRRFMYKTTPM